jgi:hypothetical protein
MHQTDIPTPNSDSSCREPWGRPPAESQSLQHTSGSEEPSDCKAVTARRAAGTSPPANRAASLNTCKSLGGASPESQSDSKERRTTQEAQRRHRYRQLSAERAKRAPKRRSRPRRHCPRTDANDSVATPMKRKRGCPPVRDACCLESPLIGSAEEEIQLRTRRPVGQPRGSLDCRQSGKSVQVPHSTPPQPSRSPGMVAHCWRYGKHNVYRQ